MARPATGQGLERETRSGGTPFALRFPAHGAGRDLTLGSSSGGETRSGVTSFALRFRAYGERRYLTLGYSSEGWTRRRADEELANILADVRRGIWRPPEEVPPTPVVTVPTFHVFASEWLAAREQ